MKKTTLALTVAATLAACSTGNKNHTASRPSSSPPILPINSMAMTQKILKREISNSMNELETAPIDEKQAERLKTRLKQLDAAMKDLESGMAIIISENEKMSKQQSIHLKEIETLTNEKKKISSRLEKITLQRNWLAAAMLTISTSFVGIFLGPHIIRTIINFLKW